MHRWHDALHYVLFFIFGDDGRTRAYRRQFDTTLKDFIAYRLMVHDSTRVAAIPAFKLTAAIAEVEEEKNDNENASRESEATLTRFPVIHYGRALFQPYLAELDARLEDDRLLYLRFHQNQLHIDRYNGLFRCHGQQ